MGTYDGAEICEIVGMFMLSLLSKTFSSNNIGFYIVMTDSQFLGTLVDNKRKNFKKKKKWFKKDNGLQIIIKCNLKIVDYLDVTLNLTDGTYRLFHKHNEETTFIHVESDHPLQIVKKIPRSIEKRLFNLSSTKGIFENSKDYNEQRLRQCEY